MVPQVSSRVLLKTDYQLGADSEKDGCILGVCPPVID